MNDVIWIAFIGFMLGTLNGSIPYMGFLSSFAIGAVLWAITLALTIGIFVK